MKEFHKREELKLNQDKNVRNFQILVSAQIWCISNLIRAAGSSTLSHMAFTAVTNEQTRVCASLSCRRGHKHTVKLHKNPPVPHAFIHNQQSEGQNDITAEH